MPTPIILLAEQLRGRLADITWELLGLGRELADTLGAPLHVVLLGREAAPLAPTIGRADSVLVADDPRLDMAPAATVAAALEQIVRQKNAGLVLIGGTNASMGVGTLLGARAGLPFVGFCQATRVEGSDLVLTSQLFGGKIFSDVRLPEARGVACIHPGAFPAAAGQGGSTAPAETVTVDVAGAGVEFRRHIEPDAADVDLTKQEVLVGVGRGIQSQDNVALAEELAQALGGAVCASRPVIDQGWLPLSRQVGKSGMIVKPRLYLAFGISGAPEHWEGVLGSQTIVAVNTDPKAPIFDGAHYGVVGDAIELLPLLTEKIKARRP